MSEKCPWANDHEMRSALETAGWRYAILIGITGDPDQIEQYKEDQIAYAHLIKRNDEGLAIWNCEEAARFVSDITGYPVDISDQWLQYDWPP